LINAEALETAKGKKARDTLMRRFRKQPQIVFKSRFRDAYGRYVADVWSDEVYINQLLLDKFLAVKVG
jgi:endonuclease YncB( thermonuclease family)